MELVKIVLGFLLLLTSLYLIVAGVFGWLHWSLALFGVLLGLPAFLVFGISAWGDLRQLRVVRRARHLARLAQKVEDGASVDEEVMEDAELATRFIERHSPVTDEVAEELLPFLGTVGPLREHLARAATQTRGPNRRLADALEDLSGIQGPRAVKAVSQWLFRYAPERLERLTRLANEVPPEARVDIVRYLLKIAALRPEDEGCRVLEPFLPELHAIARGSDSDPDAAREARTFLALLDDGDGEG